MASSIQQKDFLSTVEEYLDRGEVYKSAEVFVKELALCPRCMGGKQQLEVLEKTLFRMVSLVKAKLDEPGRRNKSFFQSWLKKAAQAMVLYQVISREWICANVWKLPDLPQRKEQEYDPTKGHRDIRFFPDSGPCDTALLKLTEEEKMETDELDYLDEEALLSLSPTKDQEEKIAVSSPRRSPRLLKKAHISASPVRKESDRKKPQEQQREDDKTQTCSQGKTSPEKGSQQKAAPSARTCSRAKGTSKESQKRSEEDSQDIQLPKSVQAARKLQEVCSTPGDGKQRAKAVMDSRGACSSTSSERHVRIVEGHVKRSDSTLKRPVSGKGEDLIISTSVLKKARTEEIVSQVRQKVVDRRESKEKKERRKSQKCWVPGCTADARYMKAHACYDHLPAIFDERFDPSDERILRGRRNALKQAGRWLLGRPVELDELVAFVIVQKLLSHADNTEVTRRQEAAMQEFCKFLQEPIPDKFILEPCNSVGVLLHWKALLLIVASLAEEERDYWRKTFQAPEDAELQEVQPEISERVHPEAFDSHFHLDRTLHEMFLPAQGTLDDILQQAPVDEDKKISLVGAVAIYCDPRTFPSERYLQQMPEHISVGIGLHPKHAKKSVARVNEEVRQLQRLLRHPRVVAFGEVGLDHSEPLKYWAYQIELLEKVLPYLEDRHVLVIHCRGMHGDCGTEAFLLLLHFLKKYVRPHQPLHLHCFTGNSYVLDRWLEVFPRTYFGFTNRVRSFNRHQIEALCRIDENRLLLESDAPYFPIEGATVSSPSQLYVLAETMAIHRQLTAERVLEITLNNARHLYQSQQ